MKVKIEIDTKTFVRFWLVVIGFALAALAIYSAQVALIIIFAAFFLALALNTPVSFLARILPGRSRLGGTAISYVAVLAILAALIFLVIPPIAQQTSKLVDSIPSLVDGSLEQYGGLKTFVDQYNLQPQVNSAVESIKNNASSFAGSFGSGVVTGLSSLFSAITATILILVLAFLMLIEGPGWFKRLWSIYDDKDRMRYHREVLNRMYTVVTGYVIGQLTVSAIAGVVAGLSVFILSLIFDVPTNFAIPTAAIVFVSSLIPLFGAMIGAAIVGIILAFNNFTAAVIFIIFFILYQQVEANYISPKIQSKRINLSALAILVSVTIGIYLFGIAGGIISIPIAGCIKILVEEYIARRKKRQAAEKVEEKNDAQSKKVLKSTASAKS